MPKIKDDSLLSDNPNSVINASKYIRTISLKNLDNPMEEPTMKSVDSKTKDEIESLYDEFNDKLTTLDSLLSNAYSIQSVILEELNDEYSENFTGAGRFKRGKSSRGYTLSKLQTAETPKGRYWGKMSDFPYQVKGAGRSRMRGGADSLPDFDLGLDEEDEEDEFNGDDFTEATIHTPEPSWNEYDPPAGYVSLAGTSNSSGFTEPEEERKMYDPNFSISKLIELLLRSYANAKSAKTFFDSKLRPKLNDIPRLTIQRLTDSKELLAQVAGIYDSLNNDENIPMFSFLPAKYEKGLTTAYGKLDGILTKLIDDVVNSVKTFTEKRRTGSGRMSGGGSLILSSIDQYKHIPTKYML
jgi:hypothetical protein